MTTRRSKVLRFIGDSLAEVEGTDRAEYLLDFMPLDCDFYTASYTDPAAAPFPVTRVPGSGLHLSQDGTSTLLGNFVSPRDGAVRGAVAVLAQAAAQVAGDLSAGPWPDLGPGGRAACRPMRSESRPA